MEFEIVWTPRAISGAEKIKEYLSRQFGKKVAQNYVTQISEIVQLISRNPYLFPSTEVNPDLRKAIFKRKTIIFYRVQKNRIVVIKVKDHRAQH